MENVFDNHCEAALALLCSKQPLKRKEGQFLGQMAVTSEYPSEKQLKWLCDLLRKAQLPPLEL